MQHQQSIHINTLSLDSKASSKGEEEKKLRHATFSNVSQSGRFSGMCCFVIANNGLHSDIETIIIIVCDPVNEKKRKTKKK